MFLTFESGNIFRTPCSIIENSAPIGQVGLSRVFGKYCPFGRLTFFFWSQGILKKRGIPMKGLVFATKLEQYTCRRLITYITFSWFFQPK